MNAPESVRVPASIVVVGSINVDLVAKVQRHPMPGETIHGNGGRMLPGGKGANQAVAAARLGARVSMIGAVGSDPGALVALDSLENAGVDISRVKKVDGPSGLAIVTVAESGENSIVVVPGANDSLTSEVIYEHADLLEATDIVIAQGEIPAEGINALARIVKGRFIHNPAPVLPLDREAFCASSPLVVNEHEAGLVLSQVGAVSGNHEPAELVSALRNSGIESVILTLGSKGALVADSSGVFEVPAARVTAVDSTGAGDAFIGALASRLARGETLKDAATFAARVGAFAVTKEGAQPSYPTLEDALPELEVHR